MRAVPQASACGQQLLAASLASLLGCRQWLCSAVSCWAWLSFLVWKADCADSACCRRTCLLSLPAVLFSV
eukprot:1161104-Pelagomonas_calceolata.AAC.5